MPKIAKQLTDKAVDALRKKPGMHRVGGCAGLTLRVSATGGAAWVLRAWVKGKRKDIRLGSYPGVTLKAARERGHEAHDQIFVGIDPNEQRKVDRKARRIERKAISFDKATAAYLDAHVKHMRNSKHRQQWENTLATYASPFIGKLDVADIDLEHVKKILSQPTKGKGGVQGPLWETKNETANRLRGRIEVILDMAKVEGYRQGDNPARWKGSLDKVYAAPSKVKTVKNFESVPYPEVPVVLTEIRKLNGHGARALEWTILTAVRSGEARGALWSEIDKEAKVWRIPAERMKMKVDHTVPLSDAALEVLERTLRVPDCDFVFPSSKAGELSDMTLSACMKRLGRKETVHGFRSSFVIWAAKGGMDRDLREMCLAHQVKSKTEERYQRDDLVELRRPIMDGWADHCLPRN